MTQPSSARPRLLVFNLATDADDPVLGFTTTWLNALAERCEVVDVITMRAGRLAVAGNVHVHSVGKESGVGEIRRALRFWRILAGLLRRERYDAAFAHMMPLFAILAAPLLHPRRVPMTLWFNHRSVTLRLRLAERLVDHVVTSSLEGFRLESTKCVPLGHGIDTDAFCPSTPGRAPAGPFTVLAAGRIAPIKGLDTVVEGVALARSQRGVDLRLRLVGEPATADADFAQGLRRRIEALGLVDAVELPGAVRHDRMVEEYRAADVLVNLSPTGGQDKVVLEAMACGLPVVTSNDAFREPLGVSGSLVVPEQDASALAARLWWLVGLSTEERGALGAQLRSEVVRHHGLSQLVDRLLRVALSGARD
jgi:glycosyltransferase involved in cell wall biosynthesis